jgi:hypothetical protein
VKGGIAGALDRSYRVRRVRHGGRGARWLNVAYVGLRRGTGDQVALGDEQAGRDKPAQPVCAPASRDPIFPSCPAERPAAKTIPTGGEISARETLAHLPQQILCFPLVAPNAQPLKQYRRGVGSAQVRRLLTCLNRSFASLFARAQGPAAPSGGACACIALSRSRTSTPCSRAPPGRRSRSVISAARDAAQVSRLGWPRAHESMCARRGWVGSDARRAA